MCRWWLLGAVLAGCVRPGGSFACDDSTQCTGGGTCEPTGFCSFVDGTCPGGSRYSEAAGNGLANTCVEGELPIDAPVGPICGNSMIEAGEDCDDGNLDDGDACNSICLDCSGAATVVSNGHCYFRIDTLINKAAAQTECANRGGNLVSYDSTQEDAVGAALILGGVGNSYWIGMDIAAPPANTQTWLDGTPLGFTRFAGGEPDDAAGSRCVDQARTSGLWGDEVCTNLHGFICERERP